MEVKDVLRRLTHLGLEIRHTGLGHHKIHDPKTGAWLFNVSSTPSDPNWHYNIARHLRRIGMSLQVENGKKKKKGRRLCAVDLIALAKAQDAAEAAGEHIPQLEDLDEAPPTSPLWTRIKTNTKTVVLSAEAQEEVIENMAIRAESAKVTYLRSRLVNFFYEKNDELAAKAKKRSPTLGKGLGAKTEFVRTAIDEVGPQRGIRTWKSIPSGQQTISKFLDPDSGVGLSVWTLGLIEATMDHINGLKWGIDEERIKAAVEIAAEDELVGFDAGIEVGGTTHTPPVVDEKVVVEEKAVMEEKPVVEKEEKPKEAKPKTEKPEPKPEPVKTDPLREQYAQVLLKKLDELDMQLIDAEVTVVVDKILSRLDQLLLEK